MSKISQEILTISAAPAGSQEKNNTLMATKEPSMRVSARCKTFQPIHTKKFVTRKMMATKEPSQRVSARCKKIMTIHEVCDQGACLISDQKLSLRMMENHPDGKQEWKEGSNGQARHGPGAPQAQGGHHHVREEEQGRGEEGAKGAIRGLLSPSSTSMSAGSSSQTTGTPKTPGKKPPRLVVSPLWKRKSVARKSSSFRSPRAAIRRMSQVGRQVSPSSQAVVSKMSASNISYMSVMSPTPMEACPGSTKPHNVSLVYTPYHPEQSASSIDRPAVGWENRPI